MESLPHQEDVVSDRSRRGLSRGDRRRNQRLSALREIVTRETAVISFDLAANKQAVAVCDPDSRVLTRRTITAKAWQLGQAVEWGIERACEAGFSSVVVACEPTGHRWRGLDQLAPSAGCGWCVYSRCWCAGPAKARTSPATRTTTPTR